MTVYSLALYIHLLALIAAAATSSAVHMAAGRVRAATSVAEARQWHGLVGRIARIFPIATLTLFASGGFMVSVQSAWSWRAGWVMAGVAGVAFLLAAGALLAVRSARAGQALARLGSTDMAAARAALRDPVAGALSWMNTGVALGVVYAMAAKPQLVGAFSALALGAVAGLAIFLRSARRAAAAAAAEPAAQTELAA